MAMGNLSWDVIDCLLWVSTVGNCVKDGQSTWVTFDAAANVGAGLRWVSS